MISGIDKKTEYEKASHNRYFPVERIFSRKDTPLEVSPGILARNLDFFS